MWMNIVALCTSSPKAESTLFLQLGSTPRTPTQLHPSRTRRRLHPTVKSRVRWSRCHQLWNPISAMPSGTTSSASNRCSPGRPPSCAITAVVERLVGKYGFVQSVRAPLRSIFEQTYVWLQRERTAGLRLVQLPRVVWMELAVAALLLPFASFNLSAEWSNRVECTDSSMSRIGRAWGIVSKHEVQTIARYTDCGKVYTNLTLPGSIGLTAAHQCPLRRIRLPVERIKWHLAGAPWSPKHIILGEADAIG